MTLPIAIRNRLAELILDSLHHERSRDALEALAAALGDEAATSADSTPRAFPPAWFDEPGDEPAESGQWREHAAEIAHRAGRAARALRARSAEPPEAGLAVALDDAATLFDAGLYFEVHELLEPQWRQATAADRTALQGLIQIAVGFQHLANGNVAGARSLLGEGTARTLGRSLGGLDLDCFARGVRRGLVAIGADPTTFDWDGAPRFPRAARA
jgi:hypothetical protein